MLSGPLSPWHRASWGSGHGRGSPDMEGSSVQLHNSAALRTRDRQKMRCRKTEMFPVVQAGEGALVPRPPLQTAITGVASLRIWDLITSAPGGPEITRTANCNWIQTEEHWRGGSSGRKRRRGRKGDGGRSLGEWLWQKDKKSSWIDENVPVRTPAVYRRDTISPNTGRLP